MKEKFKADKLKTYTTVGAVALGFVGVMFALSSMFEEKKNQSAPVNIPTFKYDNSRDTEVKTFRKEYGKQLLDMENENKELRKKFDEMEKKMNEKPKDIDLKFGGGYDPKDLEAPKSPIPPPLAPESAALNPFGGSNSSAPALNPPVPPKPVVTIDSGLISIKKFETKDKSDAKKQEDQAAKTKKEEDEKKKLHIPAGAILSGILLNGVDAPTGGKAKNSPHPVLVEVKDLGILPNEFSVDLKGCFAVGSAYGDLSSERAYIRVENLSCIKKDGTPLEAKNSQSSLGFVTGEDGKVGLFGRVVSKQGTMLARTIVAGFLEGASKAFQQSNTFVSVSPTGSSQSFDPAKAGETSMFSGAAEASKKLADFYMKLVDEMFPVVEINAKRKVDILMHVAVDLEYGIKDNLTNANAGQNQARNNPSDKNTQNTNQNIKQLQNIQGAVR